MPEQRAVQITVASPKGGVGKTMTTILLAGEFAAAGHRVTVLDTDPQLSAVEWSKNSRRAGYALSNIDVIPISSTDDLIDRLAQSDAEDLLLVDVQGTAVAALGPAVANADFVLIPTKAHVFDIKQCLGLIRHIRSLGGRHREIPYAVMLNMVSGIEHNTMAFRTAIQLLRQADASVLETFLSQRPTFASIATAGTLYEVKPVNKAVEDARDQTNALTAEIIRKLNGATRNE
ncbi:ParA family protein [Mesorhizobium sp. M0208]|uniref:ParA family protein n=1 Tax=Mesorhizobium sp. M0208 TaxID=2956916 RepID=UPI00333CB7DC